MPFNAAQNPASFRRHAAGQTQAESLEDAEQGSPPQRLDHGGGVLVHHPQQVQGRAADRPFPLFPFAVAGQAHTHQRGHSRLRQLGAFANLPGVREVVIAPDRFAPGHGKGFFHGLDKVVFKTTHFRMNMLCKIRVTGCPSTTNNVMSVLCLFKS